MRTWFRRCSTLAGLALAAVALTATAASAQQKAAAGFLGGASFSTLTGTDSSVSPKSSTGFAGGFFVNFPVAKSLRLEPEILYINKGSGFEDEDFTLNLNYIEIPVLLRYQFTEDGGPFAYVGPYVGFNVKCNSTVDTLAVPCKDLGVEAKTDFGGTIGVGYRKEAWGFDIRYDFGFTDVITDEQGKNSALMIMLRVAVN
jgi:opacity protein-like surface antigen